MIHRNLLFARACELHELNEEGRAEAAVDSDAFAIEPVDERDDVLMRTHVHSCDQA